MVNQLYRDEESYIIWLYAETSIIFILFSCRRESYKVLQIWTSLWISASDSFIFNRKSANPIHRSWNDILIECNKKDPESKDESFYTHIKSHIHEL